MIDGKLTVVILIFKVSLASVEYPLCQAYREIFCHAGQLFGSELKTFADRRQYRKALIPAAKYGKQLGVSSS